MTCETVMVYDMYDMKQDMYDMQQHAV